MRRTMICLSVLLAGCATQEQRAAEHRAYLERLAWQCANYGFQRGTPHFGQCMMQLDAALRQQEEARSAMMIQQGAQMIQQSGPRPFGQPTVIFPR